MAGMKAEYLRHEYTWSNHCITGNSVGWGMTASTCPEKKELLRELEKTAFGAEPDKAGQMMVEELSYNPSVGFVKMTVVPCKAGEDKRQNKKVFLYQPRRGKQAGPEEYIAPSGIWQEEGKDGYLSLVEREVIEKNPGDILEKWNIYDRLPDFLRAVFWCLSEKRQGVNIVASSWEKKEFAKNAGELMYAIHSLLPKELRKKAGYLSYAEQEETRESFFFSKRPCGKNVMYLDKIEDFRKASESPLEEYFFYHLARLLVTNPSAYASFLEEADGYLKKYEGSGNIQKKLEWLFYDFSRRNSGEVLEKAKLFSEMAELFYWAAKEPELRKVSERMIRQFREDSWSEEEKENYLCALLDGVTKRGQETICRELDWILQGIYEADKERFLVQREMVKERKKGVYGLLLLLHPEQEGSWQEAVLEEHLGSFEALEEYVRTVDQEKIPEELAEKIMNGGIRLLNGDIFLKKSYEQMESLMLSLQKKEQWAEILDTVVRQMEPKAETFDDGEAETACYVEEQLDRYLPGASRGILREEYEKRQKADVEPAEEMALVPVEEEPENGRLADALLVGYPQGFLTGCALYLSGYSLAIGHWKIAVGMGGMWLLFMLNYYYMLLHKENQYPFWKNLGLCLLEGYVIQFVGGLFLAQQLRLYYFLVLGVLAVGMQIFNIVRAGQKS
ncbi:MAG: hypothetical protein Q4D60_04895 [Eubacteriales bacterium]|nr:hypothetical protein [Eubacteriales bacterium]